MANIAIPNGQPTGLVSILNSLLGCFKRRPKPLLDQQEQASKNQPQRVINGNEPPSLPIQPLEPTNIENSTNAETASGGEQANNPPAAQISLRPQPLVHILNTPISALESSEGPVFRFLDLPGEIRNQIYELTLCPIRKLAPCLSSRWHEGTVPPLLLTSRQTYREALAVYYGKNHFSFSNLEFMATFLQEIGQTAREHLTELTFLYTWVGCALEAFELLRGCRRLSRLTIEIDEGLLAEQTIREEDGEAHLDQLIYNPLRTVLGMSELRQVTGLDFVGVEFQREAELALDEEDWYDEIPQDPDFADWLREAMLAKPEGSN
ncbi:MAG: hypothetical protein M1829_004083 [Trizodia sp. TS-e1964]|nr:MAG: hypothetical protein M1829_004083 [Trizodia sp. TS-e1964]